MTDAEYAVWLAKLAELVTAGVPDGPWNCGKNGDRFWHAREAARLLELQFEPLKDAALRKGHACCDCEILFNCGGAEWEN